LQKEAYGSSDARKALEWGAQVRLGKVSPADSLAALHTTIAMKLKYPLAALTLTEKECNHIMAPAIRAALPKAGFSGSMSSIFRHAPIASLGLNVTCLYTTMGTTRTALLVHHSWKIPRHDNFFALASKTKYWKWECTA